MARRMRTIGVQSKTNPNSSASKDSFVNPLWRRSSPRISAVMTKAKVHKTIKAPAYPTIPLDKV